MRAHGVGAQVLDEQAERAQEPGARRHRERRGCRARARARPRAAARRPRTARSVSAGRVHAPLHGHEAHGVGHVGVDHAHDAARGLERGQVERAREALDGGLGARRIERHGAAEQARGPETAEHEVRVGDGGQRRRRARSTPGPGSAPALCGPTLSAPPESRQAMRSAARADGVDVERGHAQRDAVDLALEGEAGRAVAHEGDVGAGAAHVERDDGVKARLARRSTRPP